MNVTIFGTQAELDHFLPAVRETLDRLGGQCLVTSPESMSAGACARVVLVTNANAPCEKRG